MTQPNGQRIGGGYVELAAKIDTQSIAKAASQVSKDVDKGVSGAKGALNGLETAFSNAGNKADQMARDINKGVDKIDTSEIQRTGRSIDDLGDNMGNTASRSAQFAGGLGDLGGALGSTNGPLKGLGAAMEAAGPAIMGVTGAADLAEGSMLLLKSAQNSVMFARIKDTAAIIGQRVAMIAGTVATGVATAAQWAWNVALNANPIGLVVLAIGALIVAVGLIIKNWDKVKGATLAVWGAIKSATEATWNAIKGALGGTITWLKNAFTTGFNGIKAVIQGVWNFIRDNIISPFKIGLKAIGDVAMWVYNNGIKPAINLYKTAFSTWWTGVSTVFTKVKGAFTSFKDHAISAFTKAKDGIKTIWDKLKNIAASPVNFLINSVYNNGIKKLWNGLAGKVGLGSLPDVAPLKFAKGGIAPGVGSGDTVPAMLTPGEGILTKREMAAIGGPKGFQDFRDSIQYFADGGIVGWMKDKIGSPIRGALASGANAAANKFIRPAINSIPGSGMFADGSRGLGNRGVDGMLNFLKGDDKKNAGSGSISGWQAMAAWVRSKFPGQAITSTTGGGHAKGSYHYSGRAIDIMPSRAMTQAIIASFGSNIKELISPWTDLNMFNGKPHKYSESTERQHGAYGAGNAHTHWAMDRAGVIPAGSTVGITNATSKDEYMMTAEHMRTIMGPLVGDTNYNVTVNLDPAKFKDVQEMLDAINALGMMATTKKVLN